jgi:hypothetical protein
LLSLFVRLLILAFQFLLLLWFGLGPKLEEKSENKAKKNELF